MVNYILYSFLTYGWLHAVELDDSIFGKELDAVPWDARIGDAIPLIDSASPRDVLSTLYGVHTSSSNFLTSWVVLSGAI